MDGRELTFDFGEGLIEDNLVIVDRETHSVWSQLLGKAVEGPMRDTPLQTLPTMQTTWSFWRERHPDTRVAVRDAEGRPYSYQRFEPGEPRERGVEHDTSTLGMGLVIAGDAWFFPLREMDEASAPYRMEVGGQVVTIHYSASGRTAWAEDASGEMLVTALAYEPRWMAIFPESSVFER